MFRGCYGYCSICQPEEFMEHGKTEVPNSGESKWIVNKSRWACQRCNHEAKNKNKQQRGKEIYTGIRQGKKTKKTIEQDNETYRHVWNNRAHVCTGCGQRLYKADRTTFAHTIPKGWSDKNGYPELRNDPDNLTIKCTFGKKPGQPGCHFLQDFGTIEQQKQLNDYLALMEYRKTAAPEYYELLISKGHTEV